MTANFIRKASESAQDMDFVLRLSNDPDDRKNSFSHLPITPSEHEKWYRKALSTLEPELWIIGDYFGYLKYSQDGEISVSIAPDQRNKGYAKRAIQELMRLKGSLRFKAQVKDSNDASLALFRALGFKEAFRTVYLIKEPEGRSSS